MFEAFGEKNTSMYEVGEVKERTQKFIENLSKYKELGKGWSAIFRDFCTNISKIAMNYEL